MIDISKHSLKYCDNYFTIDIEEYQSFVLNVNKIENMEFLCKFQNMSLKYQRKNPLFSLSISSRLYASWLIIQYFRGFEAIQRDFC